MARAIHVLACPIVLIWSLSGALVLARALWSHHGWTAQGRDSLAAGPVMIVTRRGRLIPTPRE